MHLRFDLLFQQQASRGWTTLETTQKKLTETLLPRIGLNRHFPRVLCYASTYFGGSGILHLPLEQGISHMLFIIGHLRTVTQATATLIQLLETIQFQSGLFPPLPPPIMEYSEPLSYIDAPWLETARDTLRRISGKLVIPQLPKMKPLRTNDQSLMEMAISFRFSTDDLRRINNCRSFLRVTSIAEISNNSGTKLLQTIAEKPITSAWLDTVSTSHLQWAIQECPGSSARKTWFKFLQKLIKPGTARTLKEPLGNWHSTFSEHRQWHFLQQDDTVLHQDQVYRLKCDQRHYQYDLVTNTTLMQHSNPHPFTPDAISQATITSDRHPRESTTIIEPAPTSKHWWNDFLEYSNLDKTLVLYKLQATSTVHIISDGSHNYDTDTFGWLLATDTEIVAEGYRHCPQSLNPSSYRAEAYGM